MAWLLNLSEEPMIRQPHDRLFGRVFSDLTVAAGHLQAALPGSLADAYAWEALAPMPTALVTRPLRERRTDLRFSVPRLDGGPAAELLLLFHHQSRSDRRMALRLAEESILGLARWGEQHRQARRLPWFLPVVLAHGRRRWSAPTDLRALLDLPAQAAEVSLLPSVPYLLQDLSQTPDEALRGTPLGVVAQRALKHAWRRDLWQRLPGWEPLVVQAHRLHGDAATEPLLEYMINVCPEGPDAGVRRWIVDRLGEQEANMVKSWAQKLRDEGRVEGHAEGHAEGHGQGARQTREALVLRLLQGRFGALPAGVAARVAGASDEALEQVVDGIFRATSVDELLPG